MDGWMFLYGGVDGYLNRTVRLVGRVGGCNPNIYAVLDLPDKDPKVGE